METNSENQPTRFDIIEKCFYTNNFDYYVTAQTVTRQLQRLTTSIGYLLVISPGVPSLFSFSVENFVN